MNKQEITDLINDLIDANSAQNQFAVSTVAFHKHNGMDSPSLPFTNLSDVPISYYGNKGRSIIVAPSEKLLEFSSGVLPLTATDGFLALPTCAGTPTGTPAVGAGATILDTTAGKIWCYYGGAWHFSLLT